MIRKAILITAGVLILGWLGGRQEPAGTLPPAVEAPGLGVEVWVTGTAVRLREGPGTSFATLASLPRGTRLSFAGERQGDWMRVANAAAGLAGWMHGDFLSRSSPRAGQ